VSAFRQKIKVIAPLSHRFTDHLFAGGVTFGGVDDVHAGVDGFIEDFLNGSKGGMLITDLPTAEAENADVHIRFAEFPVFHGSSLDDNASSLKDYGCSLMFDGLSFLMLEGNCL